MTILAFDTATPATTVALATADGRTRTRRHDPGAGERPGHQSLLLSLAVELLDEAGTSFAQLDRIAVGVGPGTFTGLRIGVATARALAQAHALPLVGVSTLHALALVAAESEAAPAVVLGVLDARRGEAFAAAWAGAGVAAPSAPPLLAPAALTPQALVAAVAALPGAPAAQPAPGAPAAHAAPLAVGDGALRFREQLEAAGVTVPADGSPLHLVDAAAHCRLGAAIEPLARDEVLPAYLRLPDAELALRRRESGTLNAP